MAEGTKGYLCFPFLFNFHHIYMSITVLKWFRRYAVVTGANKGIGFAISKQLASNGITVVVTARDEKKGLEAIQKLKQLDLPGHVVFHQLDVTDPASIKALEHFITPQYPQFAIN
ncbi:putative oxidoreductase [Lupinus albus]|uniref:Putative oxidoreductase n=1 Tax=Lupinus albus TaxID=3870 RepID=A0A6A4QNS8_LUPAL|nr:putative oxidoreductase [Lupinus albus]